MSVATYTTKHEKVCGAEKGNRKGCPYRKVADGLFSG